MFKAQRWRWGRVETHPSLYLDIQLPLCLANSGGGGGGGVVVVGWWRG